MCMYSYTSGRTFWPIFFTFGIQILFLNSLDMIVSQKEQKTGSQFFTDFLVISANLRYFCQNVTFDYKNIKTKRINPYFIF